MLKKNILLYWPMWVIYTIGMLLSVVGSLWSKIQYSIRLGILNENYYLTLMAETIDLPMTMFIVGVMSLITAMALFSYLFQAKSCNMIHAFPITRGELFGTNLITGFLFLLVPIILTYIISLFLCLRYGIPCVEYLGIWVAVAMEAAIILYALACFCAMFTGQLFALPIYFVVVNAVGPGIVFLITWLLNYLGFGLSVEVETKAFSWLSPIYFICSNVYMKVQMSNNAKEYVCTSLEFYGIKSLTCYLIVAVILFVAAYILYKKRNLEQAGNLLTVAWLRPIFRWGVGICGGYASAFFIVGILENYIGNIGKGWGLLLSVIMGILAFFVAQMFIEKKFRVFSKKIWKECSLMSATVVLLFGGLYVTKYQMENYIPNINDIERVEMSLSYRCIYEKEDIKQALAIHKAILSNKDTLAKMDRWGKEWAYIPIIYTLKNGKEIQRFYSIPTEGVGNEIISACLQQESRPEHFINCFLMESNSNLKNLKDGEFDLYDKNYNYVRNLKFNQEQIWQMYEAAKEDTLEGNLQKYNLASCWLYSDLDDDTFCTNLYMSQQYEDSFYEDHHINYGFFWQNASEYINTDDDTFCSIYLNFGKDSRHIIDALIDMGAIESVDDLQIYEENEALIEPIPVG